MPGVPELLVILLIVLVVFGANKLPGIGDALGRSIKNFKRASKVEDDKDEDEDDAPVKALAEKRSAGQIAKSSSVATADADGEWEEVVVRRRKKAD